MKKQKKVANFYRHNHYHYVLVTLVPQPEKPKNPSMIVKLINKLKG